MKHLSDRFHVCAMIGKTLRQRACDDGPLGALNFNPDILQQHQQIFITFLTEL